MLGVDEVLRGGSLGLLYWANGANRANGAY